MSSVTHRPAGINVGVNNPNRTVYLPGNETTDESIRFITDETNDPQVILAEHRKNGVWSPIGVSPARSPIQEYYIFGLNDFPDPVSNVITLRDDSLYRIMSPVVDLEDNQLMQGNNTWVRGLTDGITDLQGETSVPLFVTNGTSGLKYESITLIQNGSGDLVRADTTSLGASIKFVDCVFRGGNIVLVNGLVAIFNEMLVDAGVQVIQDGSGGVADIIVSNISVIFGLGAPIEGIMLFEAGSTTNNFRYLDSDFAIFTPSTAIKVEKGASINEFLLENSTMNIFNPGATVLKVENPDDIVQGKISNADVVKFAPGQFVVCEPSADRTLGAPGTGTVGVATQNGEYTITSDSVSGLFYRMTGINTTVDTTTPVPAAPVGNTSALEWFRGSLYSASTTAPGFLYRQDGFSGGVAETLSPAPGTGVPVGMVFVGNNLAVLDANGTIYILDGFSLTELASFSSGAVTPAGLAFDGFNLLAGDRNDQTVRLLKGISGTLQYTIQTTATDLRDISILPGGLAVADGGADEIQFYDTPVTFDHSSRTWAFDEITDVVDGVTLSSDKGGSQILMDTTVDVIFPQVNEWVDIADGGIDVWYGSFSENEKCRLNNEVNGEIIWLGNRNVARVITAQVVTSRGTPTNPDVVLEIAVAINGVVQSDTIATARFATASEFNTMITLPISRNLGEGDLIKPQMRNRTNTVEANVQICRQAIT